MRYTVFVSFGLFLRLSERYIDFVGTVQWAFIPFAIVATVTFFGALHQSVRWILVVRLDLSISGMVASLLCSNLLLVLVSLFFSHSLQICCIQIILHGEKRGNIRLAELGTLENFLDLGLL